MTQNNNEAIRLKFGKRTRTKRAGTTRGYQLIRRWQPTTAAAATAATPQPEADRA